MKTYNPIIWIGLLFFFIQYYLVIAFKYVWNFFQMKMEYIIKGHSKVVICPFKNTHPDVFLPTEELIRLDGFQLRTYEFKTQDNYYISLWRVQSTSPSLKKKDHPILIMHGLLDCSISWFLHAEKKKCLPYILASQGYDVWVGNNRGTKFSMKNCDQKNYWDFSFDHFVQYDQPILIDSVLKQTNKKKLIYIGHSQGSTQLLVSTGIHSHLKQKIVCFIGMGTVISLDGVDDHQALKLLDKFKGVQFLSLLGFKTVLSLPRYISKATGVLIYNTSAYFSMFFGIVNILCGTPNKNKIDLERLGVIISHEPGGASIQNVLQWIQFYRHREMKKFDHGKKKNKQIYDSEEPPSYNFEHLDSLPFNTHIFKGTKDAVISEKNFSLLKTKMNAERTKVYDLQDYAHLDYVWGVDADQHIYYPILEILKEEQKIQF